MHTYIQAYTYLYVCSRINRSLNNIFCFSLSNLFKKSSGIFINSKNNYSTLIYFSNNMISKRAKNIQFTISERNNAWRFPKNPSGRYIAWGN